MVATRHCLGNSSTPLPQLLRPVMDHRQRGRHNDTTGELARSCSSGVAIGQDEAYCAILADVPGVDAADIELSIDQRLLSLRGSRDHGHAPARVATDASPSDTFARVERSYGAFRRRFGLPVSADAEGIATKGICAVAKVVRAKKAPATSRRITISSGQ